MYEHRIFALKSDLLWKKVGENEIYLRSPTPDINFCLCGRAAYFDCTASVSRRTDVRNAYRIRTTYWYCILSEIIIRNFYHCRHNGSPCNVVRHVAIAKCEGRVVY